MIRTPQRLEIEVEGTRKMLDTLAFDMRVASPGIIQSFDSVKQTATVRIAIKEQLIIDGEIQEAQIADLVDVPVMMLRAGGYVVTFPISVGDECLLIFSDTCIDSWFVAGGVQPQMSVRRHDLSDAFAIVGIWNQARKINEYSTGSLQIRDEGKSVLIDLSPGKIAINATDSVTINATNSATINTKAATINADSGLTVNADTTVNGKLTVSDMLTASAGGNITGGLTVDGIGFKHHVHSGVQGGSGTTGPVVG